MLSDHYFFTVASLPSPGIDGLLWHHPVRPPGDRLSMRISIKETRRSRTKPDRGIVHALYEVFSMKGIYMLICRNQP